MRKINNATQTQVIVITGPGRGLGYSLAQKFVDKKYNLVVIGRNAEGLENLKNILYKSSSEIKILAIKCDVRREINIKQVIAKIEESFIKVDILINNAGIRIESSVKNISLNEWKDIIDTNLTGTFLITKYALPLLRKSDKPVIINISSVKGLYGGEKLSAYSASKFGVIGLTQSLAEELKDDGIKVYSICPAAMDTDMIRNVKHNIPKEKLIQPDEIADIIYKIATNPHEPTGQTIIITGRQKEVLEKIIKSKEYKIIQWD